MRKERKRILMFLTFALLMLVPAYATVTFLLTIQTSLVVAKPKVYFDYGGDSQYLNVTFGANKTTVTLSVPVYPETTSIYTDAVRIYASGGSFDVKLRLASAPSVMDYVDFLYFNLTYADLSDSVVQIAYEQGAWVLTEGNTALYLADGSYLMVGIKVRGLENAPEGTSYSITLEVVVSPSA